MSVPDPQSPVRADYRFLKRLVEVTLQEKARPTPEEFDRVSRVFCSLGGSWERVFRGSVPDIDLLKKVLKAAMKHGYLTKKESWS
jgi:hypothetical protein